MGSCPAPYLMQGWGWLWLRIDSPLCQLSPQQPYWGYSDLHHQRYGTVLSSPMLFQVIRKGVGLGSGLSVRFWSHRQSALTVHGLPVTHPCLTPTPEHIHLVLPLPLQIPVPAQPIQLASPLVHLHWNQLWKLVHVWSYVRPLGWLKGLVLAQLSVGITPKTQGMLGS